MSSKKNNSNLVIAIIIFLIILIGIYFLLPSLSGILSNKVEYKKDQIIPIENSLKSDLEKVEEKSLIEDVNTSDLIPVTHIATPEKVKALYISGWVAGTETFRNSLIKIADETEINAVVIDIKDSTGRISFTIDDSYIKDIGSSENRIRNINALISLLHSKNIYIIGRISVFQDPYLTKKNPEWAVKRLSDGGVWKDRKGLSFLDPTNKDVHKYILSIALNSYKLGFDEINLDYIRYPSDGNMKDINYNLAKGETRADNIEKFFKYFSTELKKENDIPLSGDLFGLTTEAKDDMGIGQVWEKALPYFDFLCPMIYPSHYPAGHMGYKNPASYPYQVIDQALKVGIAKSKAIGQDIKKIRPWLQDFDMGATYTKELVQAQMKATYDNGLSSWVLWDPSNKYTPSALKLEKE